MNGSLVVKLENVSKYYKLYNSPKERLKEALHPFRKKYHREFYALNGISLELKRGECLGIIGKNGMGKSTLLKIIANIIQPSSGTVQVNGTVSALLELGTGFNPEFTGMENIYFYGTILGFKKDEVERKVKSIVDFADIGEFIDQPVKTYSSGMFVRLAFAVQTSLKPDILLVDEVLSVGDIFFQQKCHARIEELMSEGTALVLVSHDTQLIEKYSSSAILMDRGSVIANGSPNEVVYQYYKMDKGKSKKKGDIVYKNFTPMMGGIPALSKDYDWPAPENFMEPEQNYDSSTAVCRGIALCDGNFLSCDSYRLGDTAYLFYEIKLLKNIGFPYGMATIINSKNIVIHAKDTLQYEVQNFPVTNYTAGTVLRFIQSFRLTISEGEYTISVGLGHINPEEISMIKKADYSQRSRYMESILGIVKPIRFVVESNEKEIKFPFHGYVNLEGNYLLHTTIIDE